MKEILNWLKKSNRWKHLLGGIAIGFGSDNWYCTEYTGILVAGSLELKDKLWGGKIDIIDFDKDYNVLNNRIISYLNKLY